MENQNLPVESRYRGLSTIIGWILGIFFAVCGLAVIFSNFISGLFLLFAGLILIKPIYIFLIKKLHLPSVRYLKIVLVLIFLVISVSTMNPKPVETITEINKKESEVEPAVVNQPVKNT